MTGWQGFKDTPWEGFSLRKYFRSYLVALVVSTILLMLSLRNDLNIYNYGVVLLVILSVERLVGDIYKGFIRGGSHAEYTELFRRLHIKFASKTTRLLCGFIVLAIYGVVALALGYVASLLLRFSEPLGQIMVGALGGSLSAIGGAIKDAQFEGFKPLKFIRSPIVGAVGGFVLYSYTSQPLVLLVASVGFERVVVEFYKTFFRRSVRGIFEGQTPKFSSWLEKRWIFFASYLLGVSILIFFLNY